MLTIEEVLEKIQDYHHESKVWVYPSEKELSVEEVYKIQIEIDEFCARWTSHGSQVKASGFVVYNRILLLIADETLAEVSGCSTDSSVRFIQELEQEFQTKLMDRNSIFIMENQRTRRFSIESCSELSGDSVVLNSYYKDLREVRDSFWVPLNQSKFKRLLL